MQDVPYSARFWAKVDKREPSECWEWTAHRDSLGYGRFMRAHRRGVLAHRLSYEMTHGPIPAGLLVLHHCDNPPCVNPAHLFLGTHRDNVADMDRKGRRAALVGEVNANARITEETVREIRRIAATGPAWAATCTEPGCDRLAVARALCSPDYARRRKAGTLPEHWPQPLRAREIAERVGASKKIVQDVLAGKSWDHVGRGE